MDKSSVPTQVWIYLFVSVLTSEIENEIKQIEIAAEAGLEPATFHLTYELSEPLKIINSFVSNNIVT